MYYFFVILVSIQESLTWPNSAVSENLISSGRTWKGGNFHSKSFFPHINRVFLEKISPIKEALNFRAQKYVVGK